MQTEVPSSPAIESPTAWSGRVAAIYTVPRAQAPLVSRTEVLAVPGAGLEGDRYFGRVGTYSDWPGTGREVTLIELEAIQAVAEDTGSDLDPAVPRRNIVTVGVALNHLVGREFMVGEVRLRGQRLCEPCDHMSRLAGRALIKPFLHRAGLRADIVTGGTIRVGDEIRPA